MIREAARLSLFLLIFVWGGAARADLPRLAVFSIEDRGAGLPAEMMNRLTEYLAASLAATGRYYVIPRSELRALLREQKKESYKSCYDQSCQIEIGREMAANKSVSTTIMRLANRCVVTSVIYDLRRAASVGGANVEGSCTEDGVVGAIKAIVSRIVEQGGAASADARSQEQARGDLLVKSKPEAAEVYVDGSKVAGVTPLVIPGLAAGDHSLLVVKDDRRYVGKVRVAPPGVTRVEVKLELTAEARSLRDRRIQLEIDALDAKVQGKREARRSKTVWGYSLLGGGLALVATAGVLYAVGAVQGGDAHDEYTIATQRPGGDLDEIGGYRDDIEAAKTKLVVGHVLAGTGAAALALAIYNLVTRPEAPPERGSRREAALWIAPRGDGGVAVGGRF